MSKFCVYLPALGLNPPQQQFRERLRMEMGIELPPTLGARVIVKQETGIRLLSLPDLYARMARCARHVPFRTSTAAVLVPGAFPVEASENGDVTVRLPLSGIRVHSLVADVLDFFENELHIERFGTEGSPAHIVLADSILAEQQESVLSIARSIEWPEELLFRTLVIAHNQGGIWREYQRIPLHGGG